MTRRDLMKGALKTLLVASVLPMTTLQSEAATKSGAIRAINIMNFIRAEEPREPMDLMEPVRQQMAVIKAHGFPATWLLQYDALVEGPFVEFLKAEMPANHEVGIWFEMNRKICDDAGIAWRGNPDWEWDYHVPVAYAIGYTPDERRKLADTAVATFKRVFDHDVKSVASWNLDAISVAHLSDHYGIDAFGNCRDQLATDGFTIWGAPIAAYYPSRINAWSPALDMKNQISTPMFRLLGQDPVYYYDNQISAPDTMEPVWPTGRSESFVDHFYSMIIHGPTQAFAYAQLGQENSFGWPEMSKAFPMQIDKLAALRHENGLLIETMGETGRRFKRTFKSTPAQAQVMLDDPFGHTDPAERTVWYQSKYYRANLHFRGNEFYLRDLHVYDDRFPQPFLTDPVKEHGIEQRLPAVLDGFHWSDESALSGGTGQRAMGQLTQYVPGSEAVMILSRMDGLPSVHEHGSQLQCNIPLPGESQLNVIFTEKEIAFQLTGVPENERVVLTFAWVPERSAFQNVSDNRLNYRFQNFDYSVTVLDGTTTKTDNGVRLEATSSKPLRLLMAQKS